MSFRGRWSEFAGVSIAPLPVQDPHPPIFVSGRSAAAKRRAARFGDAWMPYMYTPDMVAAAHDEVSVAAGRAVRSALLLFFCVHADSSRAKSMAIARLSVQYNQDFTKLVERYALAGSPDEVLGQAARFVEAGVEVMLLAAASPADVSERQ